MSGDIAVIGGGMFGVTAATNLADDGHDVTLFEKDENILTGASGSNHWRLHRGYHYPQSDVTAESALNSEPSFRSRYSEAIIEKEDHYYSIAEDSWVSYDEYSEFMESHGLEYEPVDLKLVNNDNIEQTVYVNENHVSPEKLRELCWSELEHSKVNTELNVAINSLSEVQSYDEIVIATYAHMNSILPEDHNLRRKYKFEICEVPIISLPSKYQGNNIIVVYGPFMSTDHWGSTGYFAMGDYHNMRHYTSTGYLPEIPKKYQGLINNGIIDDPDISNFDEFLQLGKDYIPGVKNADHIGSLFTIRTILPDVEDTDARPTMVNHSSGVTTIFGGKLATSVTTAEEVVDIINN